MANAGMQEHYAGGVELDRLLGGSSRIEFARTKELLGRSLPPPPAAILDVGGGPGRYAAWLAESGYSVHLIDPGSSSRGAGHRQGAEPREPVHGGDR
jgi:2-polyprenyl-3-methyl-5-hydroxy-6-metoxy-1,4-benzoquinol methylase